MSRAFSSDDINKLRTLINEGVQVTQEVTDLKEGLRDTVKAIAEEMQIKPSTLNKAIRIAFKHDRTKNEADFQEVEDVLDAIGHQS
jgi:uncharacterized protein YpuA (DUF1002 family)